MYIAIKKSKMKREKKYSFQVLFSFFFFFFFLFFLFFFVISSFLFLVAERGPLHLKSVESLYPTKEWLQPKRYSAHLAGTTYIYDFPELFRQGLLLVRGITIIERKKEKEKEKEKKINP